MIFPMVEGTNLVGKRFTLPYSLEGEYNIAVLSFHPSQIVQLQTWLPILDALREEFPDLMLYELPTLPAYDPQARVFIDLSIRQNIPDHAHSMVIPLYVDKAAFCDELELPSEEVIYVLLIEREGEVLWRWGGPFDEEAFGDLVFLLRDQYATSLDASLWNF